MKIIKRERSPKGTLIYTVQYQGRLVNGGYETRINKVFGCNRKEMKRNLDKFKKSIQFNEVGYRKRSVVTGKVTRERGNF